MRGHSTRNVWQTTSLFHQHDLASTPLGRLCIASARMPTWHYGTFQLLFRQLALESEPTPHCHLLQINANQQAISLGIRALPAEAEARTPTACSFASMQLGAPRSPARQQPEGGNNTDLSSHTW